LKVKQTKQFETLKNSSQHRKKKQCKMLKITHDKEESIQLRQIGMLPNCLLLRPGFLTWKFDV